jgi:endoglucanase
MNKISRSIILIFFFIFQAQANWYQSNGKLYKDGTAITLHGINWYGLETTDRAPAGLWTSHSKNGQTIGHSISWFMSKIKDLGFNAIRIPLSPQGISSNSGLYPTASWAKTWDPSLTSGWAVLNSMLNQARSNNLYVLIDYQTCSDLQIGNNLPGTPTGCAGYTLNDWINDLNTIAKLTASYPNVIGIDLFNEPHGISWTVWKSYADQAISQIYSSNTNIVYFVEGVDGNVPGDGTGTCWGENLYYAGSQPISPPGVPFNKVVYAPHVYAWCDNDWAKCFGYLEGTQSIVIVGEWGYNSVSSYDTTVFAPNLIHYLQSTGINNFFYWSFNGNDKDLGYLSGTDSTWCTVVSEKVTRFKGLGIFPQSYITSSNPPSICN